MKWEAPKRIATGTGGSEDSTRTRTISRTRTSTVARGTTKPNAPRQTSRWAVLRAGRGRKGENRRPAVETGCFRDHTATRRSDGALLTGQGTTVVGPFAPGHGLGCTSSSEAPGRCSLRSVSNNHQYNTVSETFTSANVSPGSVRRGRGRLGKIPIYSSSQHAQHRCRFAACCTPCYRVPCAYERRDEKSERVKGNGRKLPRPWAPTHSSTSTRPISQRRSIPC